MIDIRDHGGIYAGGGGAKINGQSEHNVDYYGSTINRGDLATIRRYYGMDTPIKLPDPDILPTNNALTVAISPDDQHVAVGHVSNPYVTIYKRSGDTFTKLANLSGLTSGSTVLVRFSPDGEHLVVCAAGNTTLVYKRSGDTYTKLDISPSITTNDHISYTPDGQYMVCADQDSSFRIYKRSGDTYTSILTQSATTRGLKFHPNGTHLIVGDSSTVKYYRFVNETLTFVKDITSAGVSQLDISADGSYLAISKNGTADNVTVYKQVGDIFTEVFKTTTSIGTTVSNLSFSPDGVYLGVCGSSAPYFVMFKRTGDAFTQLPNLAVLPTGRAHEVAFANFNPYMVIAHEASPRIGIYKADLLGDYAYIYQNVNDLYAPNYIGVGYALGSGVEGTTNKKIMKLPIK